MRQDAYIAMGSNLGDRQANINGAVEAIASLPDTCIVRCSTIIQTDPVGPGGQGPYLNGVVHVQTNLSPRALLDALLEIEAHFGRDRSNEQRWGPRTLDLDVLVYADRVIDEPGLCIPHPRLHERIFVLAPLSEIAPDLQIPGQKQTPREMLGALSH